MKDIQDIIKKRDDYRIKIYNLFYNTAKVCKQFISQKCIKKMKKCNERAYNLGDTMEDVAQKLKYAEDIKKNENMLKAIKLIKSISLKSLTLYFLVEEKKFDLSKQLEFFNKEFSGDYKIALQKVNENIKDKDNEISIFKRKFESQPRYLQMLEQINSVMGIVENKQSKSKQKRQIKKEKFKLKKQYNETLLKQQKEESMKEQQLTEEERKQKEQKKKQKEESKKLKMEDIKKNALINKYDRLSSQLSKEPKERTEFKKKGKERRQQLKQEKIEKHQKREQENKQQPKVYNFKDQNIKEMDKLHPSWTARLQQQQEQKNLMGSFQGTVKML